MKNEESRISKQELANNLNLSISTLKRKVKSLIQNDENCPFDWKKWVNCGQILPLTIINYLKNEL